METKQLTKLEDNEMSMLFEKAIDKNVPVETMEKLMAMRRELRAEWAKKQFDIAMAAFQKECPIIKKTKKVNFTSKRTGSVTDYSFAPLDSIVEQAGPFISKNGFSYTTQTENKDSKITSIVSVRHKDGHQEETSFEVPIDPDSFMNAQQKYASASTFSKRYAFCNAFGILTGDEDNDSNTNEHAEDTKVETTYVKPPEPMMTEFQKNKIYSAGVALYMSKEELDKHIKAHYHEDWPNYSKITLREATTIVKGLESESI